MLSDLLRSIHLANALLGLLHQEPDQVFNGSSRPACGPDPAIVPTTHPQQARHALASMDALKKFKIVL